MARAPELVPCRVGVAYVSLRVTPQSTARTVVLEVLPLLGRQVCTGPAMVLASPGGQATFPALVWMPHVGGGRWFQPHNHNSAPHRLRVLRASSWWRC